MNFLESMRCSKVHLYIAGLVFTILAGCAFGDFPKLLDMESVVARSADVTLEKYPNADEVLLDEFTRTIYQTNGTYITYDDVYVKVLTENGKRENRQLSFYYTLPYGTVVLDKLEIIKPDGSVVSVDISLNSREVVNRSQMSANIYNPNSKVLQAGVPGLEVGDILHYRSIRDNVKTRVPDSFSDYVVFEYDLPILKTTYEIFAPKELPLKNIGLKSEFDGTVNFIKEEVDGHIRYVWHVADVPQVFPEPSMPPLYTVVQRLLVSTIEDWEEISRWYWNLCLPHINAVNDDMRAKVADLTKDCSNDYEKITNVFNFVSQDIRYMGITPEQEAPGYEPHDSSMTFDNRYGVCRDKAVLLVSMLRLAGLDAFPVIINAGPKKDADVPQPYFNHAITAVKIDGEYLLMDSTDESTQRLLPAYLCDCSYLIATPQGDPLRTSPIIPASENMMKISSKGNIENNILNVDSVLNFEGINDNAYRGYFAKQKPEDIRKFFERVLADAVPGATVKNFKIEPADMQNTSVPLKVELSYTVDDFIKGNDVVSVIKPPMIGARLGMINFIIRGTSLDKRKYPLKTHYACGVKENFDINIAGGVGEPLEIPEYTNINSRIVNYNAEVTSSENNLAGDFLFTMNVVELSSEEYLEFKEFLKEMEYEARKEFIFESVKGVSKDADIEVLSSEKKIKLKDSHTWTSNSKKRIKVLTYGGKKKYSELKIAYNPVWEELKVNKAAVIAPDGSSKEISDIEMNVMDAAWAGSAPRYPAGKTMVISLPGVEIGSVIEYDITAERKDRIFFAEQFGFRGADPIRDQEVVIEAPVGVIIDVNALMKSEYKFSQVTNAENKVFYSFVSKDQHGVISESNTPPWWSFNPYVFISSASWQQYAEAVSNAVEQAMQPSENVALKARQLVENAGNKREKVRIIRDYVLKNVRLAGPSFVDLPLRELSNPEVTLTDGYGHSLDRAILFKAMLDAVNIESDIILAGWYVKEPELRKQQLKYVSPSDMSTALVRVIIDDMPVYLNTGSFYDSLGTSVFDEHMGLTFDGELFEIEVADEFKNRTESLVTMYIDDEGNLKYYSESESHGTAFGADKQQFDEMLPEDFRRYYLGVLTDLSQSAEPIAPLKPEFDSYPGKISYAASVKKYAVISDKYMYFTVPYNFKIFHTSNDQRQLPYYYPGASEYTNSIRVFLPESTKRVLSMPRDFDWRGVDGIGRIMHEVELRTDECGRKFITIDCSAKLNPAVISSEDYKVIQNVSSAMTDISKEVIVLEME